MLKLVGSVELTKVSNDLFKAVLISQDVSVDQDIALKDSHTLRIDRAKFVEQPLHIDHCACYFKKAIIYLLDIVVIVDVPEDLLGPLVVALQSTVIIHQILILVTKLSVILRELESMITCLTIE